MRIPISENCKGVAVKTKRYICFCPWYLPMFSTYTKNRQIMTFAEYKKLYNVNTHRFVLIKN